MSLLPNLPNPDGVLRSKATGEPPYMIANSGTSLYPDSWIRLLSTFYLILPSDPR